MRTLADVITDLADSSGNNLVIVNGHGGNQWLASLVQELNGHGHPTLLLPNAREWLQAYHAAGWDFGPHDDMHAGAMETSLLWAWAPNRLQLPLPPDHAAPDRPLFTTDGMQPYAPNGYIGFPQQASPEAGQRASAALVRAMREVVMAWQP